MSAPADPLKSAGPHPGRRSPLAGRSTVYAPRDAVATSQPLASAAAMEVLQTGGNAFDAVVAAAAVLNVVEPHMTGLGGDAFALFWSAEEGRLVGLDATGRAGSGMSAQTLRSQGHTTVPREGGAAVTVPGGLSGWAALLDRYGTRELAQLLAPAIRLADEGFPVSPIIASQWAGAQEKLAADEGARATYLVDGALTPRAGQWFRNPDLAASFRAVAAEGPAALYGGALGARVADGLARLGGHIALEDLAGHEPRWVEPVGVPFRGHTVWELPPAGQGVAALQMLRLLEPFDLETLGHNTPDYLHLLIEAKKLAFADLAGHVSDADHMRVGVADLLDPAYLSSRRALVDPARAAEHPGPGAPSTAGETVYLAAADRHGNMVSFINSIYEHFGSGVVVPGTGFALQNRGAGFTLEEGHPNEAAPGKRPLHTLIPGFVTRDGAPTLAFGVMGGPMQPQGHVQLLLNLLVFGMDLQDAVDQPRFRHLEGLDVALEPMEPDPSRGLARLGHRLVEDGAFGGAQAVLRLERGWAAASDPRKDGLALGY